jgi:hypothetical protein
MTAARQQRKSRLWLAGFMGMAVVCGISAPSTCLAAPDQPLVVNPNTGLAISGVDPVAYFTEGKPVFGRADIELSSQGAVWRFRNEGDRAAFADHPEVYTPRFGGYDPMAILRGRSVPGHPLLWAVAGERLYLFYSEEARTAFLADPGRIIAAAERKWPDVAHGIGR